MIGFNNGVFQELSQITIPVTSLSINRGYGAFEFFEVVRRRPFYGDRHFARFVNTMDILKLKTEFQDQLAEIVEELINCNEMDDFYIKLFALPHENNFSGFYEAALYVFPTLMPTYGASLYRDGAALVTKNFQRFLPGAKSTDYLAGQFWMNEQADPRVVDVLYHNGQTVQETSRGNIFVVKDGMVITPAENVLKGVTRGLVLEILNAEQIPHAVTNLGLETLHTADEVFLSSTTKHILPITTIDGQAVGNGKPGLFTQKIMAAFARLKAEY